MDILRAMWSLLISRIVSHRQYSSFLNLSGPHVPHTPDDRAVFARRRAWSTARNALADGDNVAPGVTPKSDIDARCDALPTCMRNLNLRFRSRLKVQRPNAVGRLATRHTLRPTRPALAEQTQPRAHRRVSKIHKAQRLRGEQCGLAHLVRTDHPPECGNRTRKASQERAYPEPKLRTLVQEHLFEEYAC